MNGSDRDRSRDDRRPDIASARQVVVAAMTVMASAAVIVACWFGTTQPATAQPAECQIEDLTSSSLRVYQCQENLRIVAETATKIALIQRSGRLVGIELQSGAAFVDTGGPRPDGFRVVTPQAEALVRGTQFAVDVAPARTSVFVRSGAVAVSREGREVMLRDGEGVDAGADLPLEVRAWPAPRAAALLTRLGQT